MQHLPLNANRGHNILPCFWIKKLFKIPTAGQEENHFRSYFDNNLNIIDCRFKVPSKAQYSGHPFYYPILKTIEKLTEQSCEGAENILSYPLWYNRYLKVQFDPEISKAGFNFVKDLFLYNVTVENFLNLNHNKTRKLRNIINKIPETWKIKIVQSNVYYSPVHAQQKINLQGNDKEFRKLRPDQIYNYLIADKVRLPAGILRWREDFELSDIDIKNAFSFARYCTSNIFNQVLQYKILTNILPTNKYLKQYRVQDSDLCGRCNLYQDTVLHSVWQCQSLVPYVSQILEYLRTECNIQIEITAKLYIFGSKLYFVGAEKGTFFGACTSILHKITAHNSGTLSSV